MIFPKPVGNAIEEEEEEEEEERRKKRKLWFFSIQNFLCLALKLVCLISIKYISLVNLIMDKEIVKELIQGNMNVANITTELNTLLFDDEKIKTMQHDYSQLKQTLSSEGNASEKAAKIIVDILG
jgi:lipid A disaccharide synthetase